MRNTLDALLHQLMFRDIGRHHKTAKYLPLVSDLRQNFDLEEAGLLIRKLARPLVSDRMSLQHLRKMAFDLAVDPFPNDLTQVLAQNVSRAMTKKFRIALIDEQEAQVAVKRGGH